MKKFIKKHKKINIKNMVTFALTAMAALAVAVPTPVFASEVIIDGYSDDWADKPGSYVYNWDNSQNCWVHGVWVDGIPYTTPEGTYSTDVRHYVQAYKDDEGIAVHIVFSRDYGAGVNSENYNFSFGNDNTSFQLTDANGNTLTNNVNNMAPGTYNVVLKHGNGSVSGSEVADSVATLHIPEDRVNAEIEFYIPYEAFTTQNGAINASDTSSVSLNNSNIMYEPVYIEGAPTGSLFSTIAGLGLAGVFFAKKSGMIDRLRNRKTKA